MTSSNRKISAALLITDGEKVLVELATGRPKNIMKNNLDLPKGELDFNEDPLDAAIRETREETGLDYSSYRNQIKEIGLLPYKQNKDIYLCVLKVDKLPDIKLLHCDSYFYPYGPNKPIPEICGYYLIDKKNLVDCLYFSYHNVFTKEVLEQIFGEFNE